MKVKNIEIKQSLREAEKIDDYYAKVKRLCEIAGVVAFYGHTAIREADNESLQRTEKMAIDTINQIIKQYKL